MRKLVLWILVFLLPTQLGYHLWPNFSFVSGFRIDYLSPTIYLTDLILILFLLLFWKKPNPKLFIPLLILALTNIFFANLPLLSLFFWARLFLYALFFNSLLKVTNLKKLIYTPLLASTVLIIIIQFVQFFFQRSIGGPLYFLGERSFNFYTPNIARLNLSGLGVILRPYSIFSHPNSLAGYLLLSLVILKSYSKKYQKTAISQSPTAITRNKLAAFSRFQFSNIELVETLISLAIIFTFSKIAIFTLFLLKLKNIKTLKRITRLAIIAGFLPLLVVFTNIKYTPGDSFLTRAFMGYPTSKIIKQNLITGTGLKGFVPSLAKHLSPSHLSNSSLQPVHSLPLLVLAELGILGLISLAVIVFTFFKIENLLLTQTLLVVFLTGAVDHYWWTLPQNQLILILALALSLKNKHGSKQKN